MTAWPERSRGIPSQPLLASRQVWLWGHVDRHHRKYSNLLRKFPCMSIQLLNCAPGGAADRVSLARHLQVSRIPVEVGRDLQKRLAFSIHYCTVYSRARSLVSDSGTFFLLQLRVAGF